MAGSNGRDVAAILNCLLCDSYFLFVVEVLSLSQYRGAKGKAILDDIYEKLQTKAGAKSYEMIRCPVCTSLVAGKSYREWSHSKEDAVLSPCLYATFAEGEMPPIFINSADQNQKPKWKLVYGLGPGGLDLHRSGDGRVYKPTLAQFGLTPGPDYNAAEGSAHHHAFMIETTFRALQNDNDKVLQILVENKPAFAAWDEIGGEMDEAAMVDPK